MNRLDDPENQATPANPAAAVCNRVEQCVESNPATSIAVTAFAGFAAGLIAAGMVRDVYRSQQRRGMFSNVQGSLHDALMQALPKDLKDKFS